MAFILYLFSELTTNGVSPSEGVLLKVLTSSQTADMLMAEQTRNYFVSLTLYIKKFPTDAIVAFVKKSLPSSVVTLDCGPEKIDGGRRYIILAANVLATGADMCYWEILWCA